MRQSINIFLNAAKTGDHNTLVTMMHEFKGDTFSHALNHAAKQGHAQCVDVLIPYVDQKAASVALCHAAERLHASCVKLLIPVSDPAVYGERPLWDAFMHRNVEIIQMLFPVSETEEISEKMSGNIFKNSEFHQLFIEMQALHEKNTLSEATIGEHEHALKKKM